MHPMVARAFLSKLLNEFEKANLRKTERSLPQGRYLQGFEICRKYNLKPKPLPEEETEKMQQLWETYAKTQLRAGQEFEDTHPEIIPKSKAEEVHAWEDWSEQNYGRE